MVPTKTPKRSARMVAAGVGLMVLVLVVAASVVELTGTKSAEATVIDSVNSTLSDHTAAISLDMTAGVAGQNVTATGSGNIDFTRDAMQLQMNVSASSQTLSMQMLYLGDNFYENIPGVSDVVPGKSWVSVDLSSIEAKADQGASPLSSEGNPAAMLRLFAQHGNTVTALGSSTVDGVAVQGYSVLFNRAAMQKDLSDANLSAAERQAISQFNVGKMQGTIDIDGSGRLRRLGMQLSISVASSGTVNANESLDFSNFGEPVTIAAPPSDQVVGLQQFLQAAQSAESAAGGQPPS